ncbi:sugar O-acetyltransferase [Photobacterium lipolyticum]|uniref:Nodulation protein L n=1 Tax=Photobacterium lipolyticum TaxID=266810 RepID=A0A2T3N2M1_9GAMM|nr:sugar O-acetyltransferase [Photobacterium lipolyticum]PSW06622.1 sugar O-acetyltransferase [Photobacterium lipolyticum]
MSELIRMQAGEIYNCLDDELQVMRDRASSILFRFNHEPDAATRKQLLIELGVSLGQGSCIEPPLRLTYGCHFSVGDGSYINWDAVILDNGRVDIGSGVMIGPRVQIYTAAHALDAERRLAGDETARPVVIEDKVWIGGGAILMPGVRVGAEAVIGAGSVVTRDVAPGTCVAGNPARPIQPKSDKL